jgi:hypothetical protein
MAPFEKKGENLSILSEIYNESGGTTPKQKSLRASIQEFFNDEKRLNALLAAAVLFFGFGGALVGLAQVRSNIFTKPEVVENSALKLAVNGNINADLLGLSKKDTDQDELSDYDELYLYGTSPYLPDSDSDGVSDKREIATGADPTCGKNGSCFRSLSGVLGAETNQDKTKNQSLYIDSQSQLQQLRKALSLSGMSEDELQKLNDEQLIAAYQAALKESATDTSGSAGITVQGVGDLQNLTPDQIRSVLRTAGISDDILQRVSDEDLVELMKQVTSPSSTDQEQNNENTNQ